MDGKNILILGGTGDAISIAEKLSQIENYKITTSLAGVTQKPRLPIGKAHIGGFGGREGLINFLEAYKINLIVDATHPFATIKKANSALEVFELAESHNLPLADRIADKARITALNVLSGAPVAVEILVFNRQGRLVGMAHGW